MNETTDTQGSGPGDAGAPTDSRWQHAHTDLERFRRSSTDRYLAGVAGGLGRHFGIDPTILRVLLVVLTFFGGAGAIIYGVCWLFVPEDDKAEAPIHVAADPRKLILIGAAGVAALLAVGDAFGGWDAGWPIATIAIVVGVILIARDRNRDARQGMPEAAPATHTAQDTPSDATWQPPAPPAPPGEPSRPIVAPRPRRTGVIWFWPTLAFIAIGLGSLAIYDNGHAVVDAAYPALALAITGVMLVVGSVVGRPGGLIALGAVSLLTLSALNVVGSFDFDAQQLRLTPATASQVESRYAADAGEIVLDLTEVADPAALAGRHIEMELRAGQIRVIAPRELNLDVEADVDLAGGFEIDGDGGGGFNQEVHRRLYADPTSDTSPLELDLALKFGQITVEHR